MFLFIEGHARREQAAWERTRVECYHIAAFSMGDKKAFPNNARDFMPLPWDKEVKGPEKRGILEQYALRRAQLKDKGLLKVTQ